MKGNLLLVDDEVLLLKGMKVNLSDLADEVFTAENGLEALEIIKTQEIHCIVCDISMPVMNGIEVIKKVRETNTQVPFIFYTGHGNSELMNQAAQYGAFDFLNKPNLDGLEEVVKRGLETGTKKQEQIQEDNEKEFKSLIDEID